MGSGAGPGAGANATEPVSSASSSSNSSSPEETDGDGPSMNNSSQLEPEPEPGPEPGPGSRPGAGANATEPVSSASSSSSSSLPRGTNDSEIHKSLLDDDVSVCSVNDITVSDIQKGLVIEPGCIIIANKDITNIRFGPQNDHVVVVTVCATRGAGTIILDAPKLSSYGLIIEGQSLISTVGYSDDSQLTVFKEDNCKGQILKRFLGTSASSNRMTQLYSLSDNNYMFDGTAISRNVWSIKMQTSTETLSDCSKTVQNSLVKLYNETKAEFLADNFQRKSGRQKFLESRAQNT